MNIQEYLENSGSQQSYSLGTYATGSKQRSLAILMLAHRGDVEHCAEENVFICSENQTAFRAISCARTTSFIFIQECGDALDGSL
ncbi:hypothetical protein NQ315_011141 [Exocentrus adspersus]|uniref:Uncharacterized protein n=1 Tax=Exocentrus adspersus TaxID=1586481 RepID=A0AAV8VWZ1_9CUCU|nr:hypothetical protein NQ315_011141 [Exocentrus adspersus]